MQASDADALFGFRCDKISNQYQGWIPETIDDVRAFIKKQPLAFDIPGTWYQFAILEKETELMIGDLGIHFIDEWQFEIGCTLDKIHQRKGYAIEALLVIMDKLFRDFNKHRAIASIDPRNQASIALVERLGFRKEAHHIESYYANGEWTDDVVYAILKREWTTS
jgi:RimJ/RimL family protein N-acetyltransferase